MPVISVKGLSKNFGGLTATDNLSLDIEPGTIHGIIGPNGAGKTTLFNLISGSLRPSSGVIEHDAGSGSARISGLGSSAIARRGVIRTFQRNALFFDFTVLRNVMVALHLHMYRGLLSSVFGSARKRDAEYERRARELLDFVDLGHLADEQAANLAHGFQRVLGVAMALAAKPSVLMLDEPVAGMNDTETAHMTEVIKRIRDDLGVTILLVEHDMRTVMGLCDRITVLNFGQLLAEGTPQEIRNNEAVIQAYLGADDGFA